VVQRGRSFDRSRAGVKHGRDFANSSVGEPDAAFGSSEIYTRTVGEDCATIGLSRYGNEFKSLSMHQ
jgi:hypothetical protein